MDKESIRSSMNGSSSLLLITMLGLNLFIGTDSIFLADNLRLTSSNDAVDATVPTNITNNNHKISLFRGLIITDNHIIKRNIVNIPRYGNPSAYDACDFPLSSDGVYLGAVGREYTP